ncbi:hypothetical protein [Butyricimonas sp.]|uniref:hypothetical protein n=1 Tax=Butyricimonas sp. TaxID=1969738 RepID=UPI0025BA7503|nr:hypothetical protein [Butyricimonas sp.]
MKKIIIFSLFIIAMSWCGCRNDCTDCEDYTRTLALYIKANGTAKDSISGIEGNIYNVMTGTRTVFKTEKIDSVYSSNVEIYESIHPAKLELDIFLEGDTKHVMMDLNEDIDFSESRIQVISVSISFGLLGLEVNYPTYQPGVQVQDDLEPK